MGFWQGLNEGLTYVMEEKARKKELMDAKQERMDERAAAQAERAADRAAAREEAQARIKAAGITAFAPLAIAYANQNKAPGAMLAKQSDLLKRLGDTVDPEDPKVKALMADPFQAAALEDQIRTAELKRQEGGISDDSIFRGQSLLDIAVGITPAGEAVVFPDPFEVLSQIDFSDPIAVAKAQSSFSVPERVVDVRLDPKVYFTADPELLKEGRKTFDQILLKDVQRKLLDPNLPVAEKANLLDAADKYSKGDLAAQIQLQDQYGYTAFKGLVGMNSAYISDAKNDPQFTTYVTRYTEELKVQTQALIDSPTASQADKNKAIALRRTWGLD